jgi:hypothetical protein
MERMARADHLTRLQGAYYIATGAWSIVHYRSFEALTGRKSEPWLVRTVGMLAVVIGIGLLRHSKERATGELADASAAAFGIADLLAVRAGQRWVYLADAVLESLLIVVRHRRG